MADENTAYMDSGTLDVQPGSDEAHGPHTGLLVTCISCGCLARVSLTLVYTLNGVLSVSVHGLAGRAMCHSGCVLGARTLPADPRLNIRRPRRVGPVVVRARLMLRGASRIGIGEPLGLSPGGDF